MKYHIYVAHSCNYTVNLQSADRTEIFLFVDKNIITLVISKLYELLNSKNIGSIDVRILKLEVYRK